MYIPGTTYLHILLHCTLYLIAHLTPYFISYLSLISFSPYLYIYIYSLVFCFIVFIAFMLLCFIFYFLHFPLSGPVLINISLPIIPCMIMYVTNNKEPWTLNLDSTGPWCPYLLSRCDGPPSSPPTRPTCTRMALWRERLTSLKCDDTAKRSVRVWQLCHSACR